MQLKTTNDIFNEECELCDTDVSDKEYAQYRNKKWLSVDDLKKWLVKTFGGMDNIRLILEELDNLK